MSVVILAANQNRAPSRQWSNKRNREDFMIPPMPSKSVDERLADLSRDLTAFEQRLAR